MFHHCRIPMRERVIAQALCVLCALLFTIGGTGWNAKGEKPTTGKAALSPPEDMVYIPAGKFIMGTSDEQQKRLACHYQVNPDLFEIQTYQEVDVPAFYIDRYEVTNRQYKEFMDATGYRPPIAWLERGYPKGMDDYPINGADYEDALTYANWAGKRLPTEEEWEKAARGTDGRLWPWGNRWEPGACSSDLGGPESMITIPAPVGSHPRDRSVYGAYDMAGNVTEWVDYNDLVLVKGGGFFNAEPFHFICAHRNIQPGNHGSIGYIGFRCAMDVPEGNAAVVGSDELQRSEYTIVQPRPKQARRGNPSIYGKSKIQVYPIYELDPDRKVYFNSMFHFLSERSQRPLKMEEMVPWRFEARMPFLPDDRITFFFESQYTRPIKEVRFNEDHTEAVIKSYPEELETTVRIHCDTDFIDLDFDFINHSDRTWEMPVEVCFQPLGAPNFRDHDGSRTYMLTDQGFKRTNEINHQVMERLWCQNYTLDEKTGTSLIAPLVQGPLIAIVSRDHEWVISPVSMSGFPFRLFNNWEYSCIHSNPPAPVGPGEKRSVKKRLYFLKGGLETLVARFEADTGKPLDPKFKHAGPETFSGRAKDVLPDL